MPQQLDNGFTQFDFSPEELISAATFNSLQKMYLQTERATRALEMVELEYNPERPLQFLAAKQFCMGYIACLDFLLEHDNAEAAKVKWEEMKAAAAEKDFKQ